MNDELQITQHAYERARKRFKWNAATLNRMASKALNDGFRHEDTKGTLNTYITDIWKQYETANNIRIYGQNIYLFRFNKLITIYRISNDKVKYLEALRTGKNK